MARQIKWTIPFTSKNGVTCVINIYAEGWTGGITALTPNNPTTPGYAAADPFYYEENNDKNILRPIRYSTGYIRLVELESGGLDDIFPSDILDRYVEVLYGGTLIWKGYVQQKELSNRFGGNPLVRDVPVISPLGLIEDVFFPTYDPPRPLTFKDLMFTALSQLKVTYGNVYMPKTGAGLDVSIASLAVCPFNDEHTYARYNEETLFSPQPLSFFFEGVCNLYGYTLREVGNALLFTAFNYFGQFMTYTVGESAIGNRTDVDVYSNTDRAITDYFTMVDNNGKITKIDSVKQLVYEFDGSTEYETTHDFNNDNYSSTNDRTNTEFIYLSPYSEMFGSSLLVTSGQDTDTQPGFGLSLLLWASIFDGIMHNGIIYRYASTHELSELFWQGFPCMRNIDSALYLHMDWGSFFGEFNNEELTDDIGLTLVISVSTSHSVQPTHYLKRNHGSFYWENGGSSITVNIDKATGNIKTDTNQPFGFIPIPATPSPHQNVFVSVSPTTNGHINQKAFYRIELSMKGDYQLREGGYSYYGDLITSVYPDIFKKKIILNSKGDIKNIHQNFSRNIFAKNQLASEYDISILRPQALASPQTRLECKFRISNIANIIDYVAYVVRQTYWKTGWRWRLMAVKFSPWNDEYKLTLHHSSAL